MKNLIIKKNGYGLRIYCTKCKKQYNHHNDICNHENHQHYKSIVSNGNIRRTKMFSTKNYNDALMSAIQFKNDVKNGVVNDISSSPDPNYISIFSAANMFLNFKACIDVPKHLQKEISTDHFKDIRRNVQQFINVLRNHNVDVETTTIDLLDDNHVGYWYEYITSNYGKGSYSTKLKIMKSFINHMTGYVEVNMRNPFKKVAFKTLEYDTSSITKREFLAVLDAVKTKSPHEQLKGLRKERKNHYRPYLIDGFKLALYTGLRREELVTLSWNDIYFSEKIDCLIIVTDNLKVERNTGKFYKKRYIPIGLDLTDLLIELGYEDLKNSDLPILEPQRQIKVKTMIANLSKGFTHFYKQAFPDIMHKKFKVLRKTYMSYLNKAVGDSSIDLTSHGSMKTLTTHYIDAEVVAKGLTMRIFE